MTSEEEAKQIIEKIKVVVDHMERRIGIIDGYTLWDGLKEQIETVNMDLWVLANLVDMKMAEHKKEWRESREPVRH